MPTKPRESYVLKDGYLYAVVRRLITQDINAAVRTRSLSLMATAAGERFALPEIPSPAKGVTT